MEPRSELPLVIDLDSSPAYEASPTENYTFERDIESILAKIAELDVTFSRFDEEDDVRLRREQRAAYIAYLSLFLTFISITLWITEKTLSDEHTKSIVSYLQTAAFILSVLSSAAYIHQKNSPDSWPIKIRTLTCSLSRDDLQPFHELAAELFRFKLNLSLAFSNPENPDYKIAQLIQNDIQNVIQAYENPAVSIKNIKDSVRQLKLMMGAANTLFERAPGYVPGKKPLQALTIFANTAANIPAPAAAASETSALLARK